MHNHWPADSLALPGRWHLNTQMGCKRPCQVREAGHLLHDIAPIMLIDSSMQLSCSVCLYCAYQIKWYRPCEIPEQR